MKLFANPASPFARKVQVVAIECGGSLDIETIAVSPVNPVDALNSENPLGKIPTLVLGNNDTLFDSRVICEYLNDHFKGGLIPAETRWQVLRRQAIADGICDAAVLVRYESFFRPAEKQWPEWMEAQLEKCRRSLAALEAECGQFSDGIDIGSLSIAVALGYLDFRYPDFAWRKTTPNLAQWYEVISQRPSMQQTQPA